MIYILDSKLNILGILDSNAPEGIPFFNDQFIVKNDGSMDLTFQMPYNAPVSDYMQGEGFILYKTVEGKLHLLRIVSIEESSLDDERVREIKCENMAIGDLNRTLIRPLGFPDYLIADEADYTLSQYINKCLGDSDWKLGIIDNVENATEVKRMQINTHTNALAKLKEGFDAWGVYPEYVVELDGLQVASKRINLYSLKQIEVDKIFTFGVDVKGIRRTVISDQVINALLPLGKVSEGASRHRVDLTFADVAPTIKAKYAEDIYVHPVHKDLLVSKSAFEKYGKGKLLVGMLETENEDFQQLLDDGCAELAKKCKPQMQYEAQIQTIKEFNGTEEEKSVELGFTVIIIDESFNPPIRVEATCVEKRVSWTVPENNEVILGEFSEITSDPRVVFSKMKNTVYLGASVWDKAVVTVNNDIAPAVELLQTDVSTVKADVGTVQGEVTTVKSDVGTLQTNVSTVQGKVGTLETDVSTVQGEVGTLQTDVGTVQGKVNTLETDVTNVINKITDSQSGNVVTLYDVNKNPYALIIKDATGNRIWRWDINGLRYTDDGGTNYKSAMTSDGYIKAELIQGEQINAMQNIKIGTNGVGDSSRLRLASALNWDAVIGAGEELGSYLMIGSMGATDGNDAPIDLINEIFLLGSKVYVDGELFAHDSTYTSARVPTANIGQKIKFQIYNGALEYQLDGGAWISLKNASGSGDITSVVAGNGITGGADIGDATVTLGTPSTITSATTNGVTATSHTHAITGFALSGHNHSGVYQPVDADLTAIASLVGTSGFLKKTASDTWTLDINSYSLSSHDHSAVYSAIGHNHDGTYSLASHTHSYQPVSADLTAIDAIAGNVGFLKKTALDTWSLDTNTYSISTHTHSGVYAPNTHTHTIADVTGLQTALDGKALSTHTHNYQAISSDLTAIDALSGTSGFLKKTATDTWALDTNTYSVSSHTHSGYASSTHNHDTVYSLTSHTHSGFATSTHNHDGVYQVSDVLLTELTYIGAGSGFVKKSGTTFVLDTNSYALADHVHAGGTYQPLSNALSAIATIGETLSGGFLRRNGVDGSWFMDVNSYQPYSNSLAVLSEISSNGFLTRSGGSWTVDTNVYSISTHNHDASYSATGHTHSYQPVDADLTAIAGLAGTTGFLKKTALNTWTLDTSSYSVTSHTHDYASSTHNHDTVYSASAHTHNYLPLTGGHVAGVLTTLDASGVQSNIPTCNSAQAIKFQDYNGYLEYKVGTGAYESLLTRKGGTLLGDVTPLTTGTVNLGSTTNRWNYVYGTVGNFSGNFAASGAVYFGGAYAQVINTRAVYIANSGQIGTVASTRRFKDNIVPYEFDYNALMNLPIVSFTYKKEIGDSTTVQHGTIAEDALALGLNDFVQYDKDGQVDYFAYEKLPIATLQLVQKQDAKIKDLEARLAKLEALINNLV